LIWFHGRRHRHKYRTWETSTCPHGTQDVDCESVGREGHSPGRRRASCYALPRQLGDPERTCVPLCQIPPIGFGPSSLGLGILGEAAQEASSEAAWPLPFLRRMRSAWRIPPCSKWPRHSRRAFTPHHMAMLIMGGGGPTFSPSRITVRAARSAGRAAGPRTAAYTSARSRRCRWAAARLLEPVERWHSWKRPTNSIRRIAAS
jgi:hypothetical protein